MSYLSVSVVKGYADVEGIRAVVLQARPVLTILCFSYIRFIECLCKRIGFLVTMQGIPKEAAIAIGDLLDHCAKIKAGQEVLLLAQIDGLYGGDNLH